MPSSRGLLVITCVLALDLMTSACPSSGPTPELLSLVTGRCLQFSTFLNPAAMCDVTTRRLVHSCVSCVHSLFTWPRVPLVRFEIFVLLMRPVEEELLIICFCNIIAYDLIAFVFLHPSLVCPVNLIYPFCIKGFHKSVVTKVELNCS